MPVLRAGVEVDAYCTRCKMDLTHKIIAVVGNKPVKVECRTCYGTHNYRPPKSGPVPPPRAEGSSARAPSAPRPARKPSAEDHVTVTPPPGVIIHPYRMSDKYSRDQWISHKVFGTGCVSLLVGTDKIEVRFSGGAKVLVHDRHDD